MSERLWSGEGCAGNPDFEFAKHSDSGVPLYRKLGSETVQLEQGGAVHIIKNASPEPEPTTTRNIDMSDLIVKSLAADETDSRQEADVKSIRKAQIERGVRTSDQVAAEMALDSLAKSAHAADPTKSAEQHYVEAIDRHPRLANML